MIKSYKKLFFSTLMALGLLIVLVVPALAQDSPRVANGFRISPVRKEYIIEPGRSETLTITIENPTDVATVAMPIINDFIASDKEDGEPRLILDDNGVRPKNSIKTLITSVPEVSLQPRERKNVEVIIRVPEDASAGGYYGAIRFVPTDLNQEGSVGLAASVGTIVLVRVPGNLVERLDLVQLSAAQNNKAKSLLTSGNVQVVTRLKNAGDIHVQPFGKVQVRNMFGKIVAEFELNSTEPRANVLPDSTRKFVNDLPNQRWLGRYTISANLGYSQGSGELITAKAAFWYLPVWAIVLLLLSIVGLGLVGYRLYSKAIGRTRRTFRRSS